MGAQPSSTVLIIEGYFTEAKMNDVADMFELPLWVDASLFSVDAVKRAVYRMGATCSARIDLAVEGRLEVALLVRKPLTEQLSRELEHEFRHHLIDEDLRERIRIETAPIRALLMAHAFSRTGLIDHDE